MDPYSLSLLISLVFGAAGVALCFVPQRMRFFSRQKKITLIFGSAGLAFLLVSVALHVVEDHQPGSPTGLTVFPFFRAHPAFVVAFVLSVAAMAIALYHRK